MLKSIQGQNVVGLSFNTTVDTLLAAERPVTIIVGRPPELPHPAMPALEQQVSKLAADLEREREMNEVMQQQLAAQAAQTAAAATAAAAAQSAAHAAHAAADQAVLRHTERDSEREIHAAADEAARRAAQRHRKEEERASVARAELAAAMEAEAAAAEERSRREAEERAAAEEARRAVEAEDRERALREEEATQRHREERAKYIPQAVAARRAAAESLSSAALAEAQREATSDARRIAQLNARLIAVGADRQTDNRDKAGNVIRIGEFPPPNKGDAAEDADDLAPTQCAVATAIKAVLLGASGVDSVAVVAVHGHDGCGKTTVLHEVANDSTVRAAFPDGAFMLRVGTDPDLASLQATLLRLHGELTPFHTQAEAADLLVRTFGELRALIILDDVLAAYDVRGFVTAFASCKGCRLLLAAPTREILAEAAVPADCMFGARPAAPELLLEILEANSSWTEKQTAGSSADERVRCLELGRVSNGVKLVIQTLAAHIGAGVDTETLCQRVQEARASRMERCAMHWEQEAGELFDKGGVASMHELPAVHELSATPDSDAQSFRATLSAAPPMPLSDSDDEAPPLPHHSSDEDDEVQLTERGVAMPEPEPEPRRQETLGMQQRCSLSDNDRSISELLLQGSFDVLSACFTTLDDTVQRRCAELATFPPAVPVPLVMLHRIWSKHGMDSFACEHLLQHLGRRGWLQRCCFQGDQTYAIVVHPIISDFLVVWWRVNGGIQSGETPVLAGHQHLVREWARSCEPVGWGVDGGYWLRHMIRHFRGAGLHFRRFALCAVFSIHWLECKIALCQPLAAVRDLRAAVDPQGYEWASLLHNALMFEACGARADVNDVSQPALPGGPPPPVVAPSPAVVGRQSVKIKNEAVALFRRLLPDSDGIPKVPSGDPVEHSEDSCSDLPASPEGELQLSAVAIPSDDDLNRVQRCVRDCLPHLVRWPGALRQQLVMHLQRAGEEGGISVPVQRFLRSAVNDPPRSSTQDAVSFNLFGIVAEWNCGNQSWQSSPAIFGSSGQQIQREGMMSEVSEQQVLRVDIDRVGKFAASCCADGSVSLWDMRGVEPLSKHELRYESGGSKIAGLAVNDDGTRMVTHTSDTVCLYDVSLPSTPRVTHTLPRASHTNIITSVAISDNGTRVATGCGDKVVRVFDVGRNETTVGEMREGHREWVSGVSMSGDGNLVVSWSDHEVCVWRSIRTSPTPGSVPGHAPPVHHPGPSQQASAPVAAPVPLPDDPANRADQERWIDQVVSAATPVPPLPAQSASTTADERGSAVSIDFSKEAELSLQALVPQDGSETGLVVEQVELGQDGSCLVVRYRCEQEADGYGSDNSAFAIWQIGAPAPMHIVDGLESRLQDVRIADHLVLSCCDDGELLLWEWGEAEISVISRWAARTGALNACALSRKGKVAACGLAGGVTALLARQVSQWEPLPRFLGIPKMAPDDWEMCCQVTRTPFTQWTRKHHCRRCGRLICNDASILGPPQSQQEREDALRQIRKTRATRLTLHTGPEFSAVSSDEEDYEAAVALGSDTQEAGLLNSAIGSAERLAAPLEEKLVGLKLARLRRCTECVEIDVV